MRNLTEIKKRPASEVVKGLLDSSESVSKDAGLKMLSECREYGLKLEDYLTLSIKSEGGLSGFELALAELNLPVRDDYKQGVVLQAASNTFQTFPGSRLLFPPVIEQILRWQNRQDQFEHVEPIVGSSVTIDGNEMVSTVVSDDSADRDSYAVAEGARLPVHTIKASETTVKMWKHGSAIRTTYEFARRVRLDMLTPYISRIARQLEISKVSAAVGTIVSGDGVNAAASSVNQSSYDATTLVTSVAGKITWENLLYWLVQRAKAGVPVDTVIGNWDSAYMWARLWGVPNIAAAPAPVSPMQNFEVVSRNFTAGGLKVALPTFAIASAAAATSLIGITKAETLQELIEAGSQIAEQERAILNQTMMFTKTENSGYKLMFGDTRQIYNYGA